MAISLNVSSSSNTYSLELSKDRAADFVAGDKRSALHMGLWDKIKEFFSQDKRSDALQALWDLMYPEEDELPQGKTERFNCGMAAFDRLAGLCDGDVTAGKKVTLTPDNQLLVGFSLNDTPVVTIQFTPDMARDGTLLLNDMNFAGADLFGADLRRADLRGANFSYAKLTNADLSWTWNYDRYWTYDRGYSEHLSGADFSGAKLTKANLRGNNLTEVKLEGADLDWADLSNTKLCGADLSHKNLKNTIFLNADLSGADFSGADLDWAVGFATGGPKERDGAIMPDGNKWSDTWKQDYEKDHPTSRAQTLCW